MQHFAELDKYLPQDHVITGIDQDPSDPCLLLFHFGCMDSLSLPMAREYSQTELDNMLGCMYRFFLDESNERFWILKLEDTV